MITLEWVEEQIERLKHSTETMQNARDLALMFIARDSLRGRVESSPPLAEPRTLSTIDAIEAALAQYSAHTPDEKQRVEDARIWASLMREKS